MEETRSAPGQLITWSHASLVDGKVSIPRALLNYQHRLRLSSIELIILLHLISDDIATGPDRHKSSHQIAQALGKDVATIQRHLRVLEARGLIKSVRLFAENGKQQANTFELVGLVKELEAAIARETTQIAIPVNIEATGHTSTIRNPRRLNFGNLTYDFETKRLENSHQLLIHLTGNDVCILEAFLTQPNRTYTRDELYDLVRGNLNRRTDRAIDLAIARLRRKLKAGGSADVIETIRGEGYRLFETGG